MGTEKGTSNKQYAVASPLLSTVEDGVLRLLLCFVRSSATEQQLRCSSLCYSGASLRISSPAGCMQKRGHTCSECHEIQYLTTCNRTALSGEADTERSTERRFLVLLAFCYCSTFCMD